MREMMGKPGPSEYQVGSTPGKNSLIKHGTLHDITCKHRIEYRDNSGNLSPGPARYNHKAGFEVKGYWEKIKARKGPPDKYWRKYLPEERRLEISAAERAEAEGYDDGEDGSEQSSAEPVRHGSFSSKGSRSGKLPRVESAPL
jgi:hypothetical protein